MPTEKQRREAARRHLERQLQRRQEREVARRKFTLIASIVGTVILIAVIGLLVTVVGHTSKKSPAAAASSTSPSPTATSPTAAPSSSARPAVGKSVSFDGVTVSGAADLGGAPGVTSKASKAPTTVEFKDLVVGTGKAAAPTSTVSVEYVGVLYNHGTQFDSSWTRGQPAQFSLAQVVKGFTEGIGGTTGVPPMKVGGRRIMILPAALGYGSTANGSIPANSPLVFVVDLKSIA
ncbi:MAG: FKBP-type peptidyl-prolyl cis-trans isomerase [Actinomycetota bacterium]|nr:FKBP-type peptidyl-prolyl cis-trans isomerase [Actinomycetota bacterium]